MIIGLGTDICPPSRWQHLIGRFGAEKCANKFLHRDEAEYLLGGNRERLAERMAGRWALREAFGKAMGLGLSGWSWKSLRYMNGKLWSEGKLTDLLASRGITRIHASVSHDGDIAMAFVILEGPE